jgi:hypothetical protein
MYSLFIYYFLQIVLLWLQHHVIIRLVHPMGDTTRTTSAVPTLEVTGGVFRIGPELQPWQECMKDYYFTCAMVGMSIFMTLYTLLWYGVRATCCRSRRTRQSPYPDVYSPYDCPSERFDPDTSAAAAATPATPSSTTETPEASSMPTPSADAATASMPEQPPSFGNPPTAAATTTMPPSWAMDHHDSWEDISDGDTPSNSEFVLDD